MSVSEKLQAMKEAKAAANLQAGEEFLANNAGQPGVVTLPSGMQYLVLTEGSGPRPTLQDAVTCHYHGTLTDGTVFDSSVQRGQPARFPLNRVIKGWQEAVQLMPTGSKWRLFIPPALAYGSAQTGHLIGPNSTLIFDVELLGIG